MADNRSPSHGLVPWYGRPRTYENETVTTESSPGPDTTRDVVLSLVINEPGKGTNPPRREIRTPMNHQDALTLAVHLAETGHAVEARNHQEGRKRKRKPFFPHKTGDPDRRMSFDFARVNERLTRVVLARLLHWQDTHRDVADYRVTDALSHLRKAADLLQQLSDDTTPDLDRARQELAASGFFGPENDDSEPRPDAPSHTVGKVPRVGAPGRYYVTATTSVPVQVVGLSPEHIHLTVSDTATDEHPHSIKAARSEAGTWLELDDPADWLDAEPLKNTD